MASHTSYRYQKLQKNGETRLLKIGGEQPSGAQRNNESKSPPFYNIIEVDLDNDHPEYETVSYSWGTAKKDYSLELSTKQVLYITESLAGALIRLVDCCTTGYLWIDQVCINQDDTAERNHQITLMGHIYENGKQGLVWLGEPHYILPEKLQDVFAKYDDQIQINGWKRSPWDEPLSDEERARLETRTFAFGAWTETMLNIFGQPWFTRTWVFQEAVLAKQSVAILGSLTVSIDALSEIANHICRLTMLPELVQSPGVAFLRQASRLRAGAVEDKGKVIDAAKFYFYLTVMAGSNTSNLRDHVYALLGLLEESASESLSIQPNYEGSIADTFTSATKAIVRSTGRLDVLGLTPCNNSLDDGSQLPSWVPNWSQRMNWNLLLCHRDYHTFCAAKNFSHVSIASFPERTSKLAELIVKGKFIDEVLHVVEELYEEKNGCRTLLVGRQITEISNVAHLGSSDEITDERILRVCFGEGDGDLYEILGTFENSVSTRSEFVIPNSKRIAFCKKGRLALVHRSVRNGDRVAILHGSTVPIVLRQQSRDFYQVVGQCNYEGGMYGEATKWEEEDGDTFKLV